MAEHSANNIIINVLNELLDVVKRQHKYSTGEEKRTMSFKVRALETAIRSIKNYPDKIESGRQVKNIKGIGEKTQKKIDEILLTGTLAELTKELHITEEGKQVEDLKRITGIGESHAKKLIECGVTSAEQLIEIWNKADATYHRIEPHLTHHIEVGIRYFKDLEERIPREEVKEIEDVMRRILPERTMFDICGSYRREMPTCGDIDILICNTNEGASFNSMYEIYNIILASPFNILIDDLSLGEKSYKGVCMLDPNNPESKARRIDIRLIPYDSYYSALLHSTGSGEFNVLMRQRAIEKGFKLSEYGLYQGLMKEKLEITSEREIFEKIQMDYVEPKDRNTH